MARFAPSPCAMIRAAYKTHNRRVRNMGNAEVMARMDEREELVKTRDSLQARWEMAMHAVLMAKMNVSSAESAYLAACQDVFDHDQQTRAQGVAK